MRNLISTHQKATRLVAITFFFFVECYTWYSHIVDTRLMFSWPNTTLLAIIFFFWTTKDGTQGELYMLQYIKMSKIS